MKVAAFQAPLIEGGPAEAIELLRRQVVRCELEGVSLLCCPEAILGGLADYNDDPWKFALRIDDGQLGNVLGPLASNSVTSIVGFTELANENRLYNAAAVFHLGRVCGVYRKLYPAIRRSVYSPGSAMPVFRVGELTFGIVICNDSTFSEPARAMAAQGAKVLFMPTNNGLPNNRAYPELVQETRASDVARAVENGVWVIRADVAGANCDLTCPGHSAILDPSGKIIQQADQQKADLLIANLVA